MFWCVRVSIHACACVCVRMRVCVCVCVCVCACVHMFVFLCSEKAILYEKCAYLTLVPVDLVVQEQAGGVAQVKIRVLSPVIISQGEYFFVCMYVHSSVDMCNHSIEE